MLGHQSPIPTNHTRHMYNYQVHHREARRMCIALISGGRLFTSSSPSSAATTTESASCFQEHTGVASRMGTKGWDGKHGICCFSLSSAMELISAKFGHYIHSFGFAVFGSYSGELFIASSARFELAGGTFRGLAPTTLCRWAARLSGFFSKYPHTPLIQSYKVVPKARFRVTRQLPNVFHPCSPPQHQNFQPAAIRKQEPGGGGLDSTALLLCSVMFVLLFPIA